MKVKNVARLELILGLGFWLLFGLYSGIGKSLWPYFSRSW